MSQNKKIIDNAFNAIRNRIKEVEAINVFYYEESFNMFYVQIIAEVPGVDGYLYNLVDTMDEKPCGIYKSEAGAIKLCHKLLKQLSNISNVNGQLGYSGHIYDFDGEEVKNSH
ncbi:hypothetical protein M3603_15310 [Rummeliibacillus stabekisii]|uniref:hypothetical protein n=1 Tax=Rummeliibacillus stabekisii TaxID=241244 RepID=UPI00203C78C8|nr:hypothetical protein [Rummeliibacillus stabekisii]MCM3317986.1 hypothetical protein [Rummeliibacillus stabekisii]